MILDIHQIFSLRSACLKTGARAAPVPAAPCRRAAALGDWRGSTRLMDTTTGAAAHLPTSACWNMRAPGSRTSGKKKARRWFTTFMLSLLGPTMYHLQKKSWLKNTPWIQNRINTSATEPTHTLIVRHITATRVSVKKYPTLSKSYQTKILIDCFCSNFFPFTFSLIPSHLLLWVTPSLHCSWFSRLSLS